MTVPGRPKAAIELLARVCGDAIEQDRHERRAARPGGQPLLTIFDEADGWRRDRGSRRRRGPHGPAARPAGRAAAASAASSCRRAAEARLARPLELGLLVDGRNTRSRSTATAPPSRPTNWAAATCG